MHSRYWLILFPVPSSRVHNSVIRDPSRLDEEEAAELSEEIEGDKQRNIKFIVLRCVAKKFVDTRCDV